MSDPIIDPAHAIPAASQLRRSRFRWRIVAFVALVIAILAGTARFAGENGLVPTASIARVKIEGNIATSAERQAMFKALAENKDVRAVLIEINSPGGTTAGGEELYEAISALRAEKPVAAYINELGASAAYMTAIAADRIFVRRLSITGSIGVLFQTANAQKLMQTIGVDLEKVQSGPLKAEPDIDEPMSDEVRASIQALVDDSFSWFVDIVAERRGLTRAEVLPLADGRIMTGNQAIASRLADAVGGEAEAIAWLEADKAIPADLPVVTWYPAAQPGWMDWGKWAGGQARALLGLPGEGPVVLDGLISLWQVASN